MADTDRIADKAKDVASQVQDSLGEAAGSARDAVEGRLHEARTRAQDAYGQARDAYGDARDRFGGAVEDAADYAGDTYDRLSRQGGAYLRDGRGQVEARVGEYPFLALLIAGAVGYGLALLVNRDR